MKTRVQNLSLAVVLVLLTLAFGALAPGFLRPSALASMANQVAPLIVASAGLTLVLIVGGIDLSVGSVLALASVLTGLAMVQLELPFGVSCLFGLLAGSLCGVINGAVTARARVPSFIVTLGMLEIARGLAYLVTSSQTQYLGGRVGTLARPLPGLGLSPSLLLAVAVVLGCQTLLSRTVFGRQLVALGTNEEALELVGVNTRRLKVWTFTLCGALAGLAGALHTAYLETADPNAAVGLELSAIAAVVIGGTSLMGGRGSVVGSFLGVLIIAVLQSGLAQLGANEPVKRVTTGAVIVAAVVLDQMRQRRASRRDAERSSSAASASISSAEEPEEALQEPPGGEDSQDPGRKLE